MPTTADPAGGRLLCIFARVPLPGRVKRRLAEELGEQGALAAHRELVEGTLQRCVDAQSHTSELWIHGGRPDHPDVQGWIARYPVRLRRQEGADLGERMGNALAAGLRKGCRSVLIGSDCPDLNRAYLRDAYEALGRCDLVLGPAEDGGYGLIGLSRPLPGLFREIPWGSSRVLATTLERAAAMGAELELLPEIYDVDRPRDWARYRRDQPRP